MNIGTRRIGAPGSVYVIAELGVNHDGSAERALELVDAAADAGADAVKTQWFEAERLMSSASTLAAYQRDAGEQSPVAMLRRLQLSREGMASVAERARRRGLHAIITVFSHELVRDAGSIGWDAYKTASPDIVHRPLLEAILATGRPLILSTGAATMEEVGRAVRWVATARDRLALLQCVSSYPTPREDAALGGIGALADAFGLPTGYSDHTRELDTGALAVACGARLLEKHLTYDRAARGPDHAASLDADGFARYVRGARAACKDPPIATIDDVRVGAREKRVRPCEQDVRTVSRQSLVTRRPLNRGDVLRLEDLTVKRPGAGLGPWRLHEIVGSRVARPVAADAPLTPEDLE